MERLTPVGAETPLPAPAALKSVPEIVDRVFRHALGRAPSPAERLAAIGILADRTRPGRRPAGKPAPGLAEGLADLLWAVMTKPEFQLIY